MSVRETYFFCGCKPWNRGDFEVLVKESNAEWLFIATPADLFEKLSSHNPRYIFFIHWSWVVPADVFQKYECICFHMTDVPYGRGGSPLQNLIIAGKKETVLTALRMVGEIDAGPVYMKSPMSLEGKAADIYLRASAICLRMIGEMVKSKLVPVAQEGQITAFKRRTPEESIMPNDSSIAEIYDHIRMLDAPTYPHAFIQRGKFCYHFTDAQVEGEEITATVRITRVEGD